MIDPLRRAFDWAFRDRRTGRVVVAQAPNPPLVVFLVASVAHRLLDLDGSIGTAVRWVATGALLFWAGDEVLRGVNPFRRVLGAVVGAVTLAVVLRRL